MAITCRRIGFFSCRIFIEYMLYTCQVTYIDFSLTMFMYYYNARPPAAEINDAAAATHKECTLPCPIIRKQYIYGYGYNTRNKNIFFLWEYLVENGYYTHVFFFIYTYIYSALPCTIHQEKRLAPITVH